MILSELYPDTADCSRVKRQIAFCRTLILKWCRNEPINPDDINEVISHLVAIYSKAIGNNDYQRSLKSSLLKKECGLSRSITQLYAYEQGELRKSLRKACKLLFNWIYDSPFDAVDLFNVTQLLLRVKIHLDDALKSENQHDPDYYY